MIFCATLEYYGGSRGPLRTRKKGAAGLKKNSEEENEA